MNRRDQAEPSATDIEHNDSKAIPKWYLISENKGFFNIFA